ncbi:Putative type II secretion system protein K [Myxococcaceae bacterium]|nr:Putative type II secretion system protein K [Myxococcaceae bacterium]
MTSRRRHREQGIVLVIVLVFVLLLTGAIATFLRRAAVDATVVRNRDRAAEAEALARGGVRLGITLLLEDRLAEEGEGFRSETLHDVWSRIAAIEVPAPEGSELRLAIRDAGSRLNLNALLEDGAPRKNAELFLTSLLERVIEDMPGRPEEKRYEPTDLTRSLLDYLDEDETGMKGGAEDEYYQQQDPPYRAANRPLLSVAELSEVEGFDGPLVEALAHYVDVHPYAKADGINPNTAPPHVLALLFHGSGAAFELVREEGVRAVLEARESGEVLCADEAQNPACSPLSGAVEGEVFPPPTFETDVFAIVAEARVGDVVRRAEAVVDRSTPESPLLLAWRVQ